MFFPELRAAIADIAAFMDDDEGSDFNAAQQRAIDAYSGQLLPTVLGGEWSRGKPGVPWSDRLSGVVRPPNLVSPAGRPRTARLANLCSAREPIPVGDHRREWRIYPRLPRCGAAVVEAEDRDLDEQ